MLQRNGALLCTLLGKRAEFAFQNKEKITVSSAIYTLKVPYRTVIHQYITALRGAWGGAPYFHLK